ncbi:MAG: DUF4339 domain-containing protein [Opitutaceae bacterium]|nr:DUF4339 domain-containing protein [Opitutaceae bacterium]
MFTIIGGDGKEYGPVTVEQVQAWITGGRANLDTQAKRVGEASWQRLGDFPEFAAAPAGAASAPPPPAATPAPAPAASGAAGTVHVDPKAYAADLIARAGPLDIGSCLERGWNLLKANFWPLVGTTFVLVAVMMIAQSIPFLGLLVSLLLTGVFYGGLYFYYLKKVRGQPAELGDAFAGFSLAFLPLMLASLVVTLLTTLGLLLLILPGIYLAVSYVFVYLLIVDHKLEFWCAMEVSRRVVTAQWWRMFGLVLLGTIIAVLGVIGLIIGIFITIPIAIGAITYAYEDLCNPPAK